MNPINAARPATTSAKVARPREKVSAGRFDFPPFTLSPNHSQQEFAALWVAEKFFKPDDERAAPTQGQAFSYFGADVDLFEDTFCGMGNVHRPGRRQR
jgi:hypothetical protein